MRAHPTALAVAVLLLAGAARAADDEEGPVRARLSAGPVWDSNATRVPEDQGAVADGALQLVGGLDGVFRAGDHGLGLELDAGGKLFLEQRGQDQVVVRGGATDALRVGERLVLVGELSAKDKTLRSGDRDYTDLGASAGADLGPFAGVRPRLRAGFRRFVYKPDDRFTSHGPYASAALVAAPFRRHQAIVGYELAYRTYPDGSAFDEAGARLGTRHDLLQTGHVGWSYRSRVMLSGGYALTVDDANGVGFSTERHRVHALVGTKLPLEVLVAAQGSFQLLRFPDGFLVSPELLLVEDDENLSSVGVKLSRPLSDEVSLELRWQVYASTFARTDLRFVRQVGGLGVSLRL